MLSVIPIISTMKNGMASLLLFNKFDTNKKCLCIFDTIKVYRQKHTHNDYTSSPEEKVLIDTMKICVI